MLYQFSIIILITLIENKKIEWMLRIYTVSACYLEEITIFRPITLIKDILYDFTYENVISEFFSENSLRFSNEVSETWLEHIHLVSQEMLILSRKIL